MRKLLIALSLAVAVMLSAVATLPMTNLVVADGGGDLINPDLDTPPFIVVDGGGDYAPVEEPPVILADGGGDYAPTVDPDPCVRDCLLHLSNISS